MKLEKFTSELKADFSKIIRISLLPALMALWVTGLNAQCPLACNNLVQVSLDDDCIVEITPDMMLEGQGLPQGCLYDVQLIGANGIQLASSPNVTSAHIGQTIQVRVWLLVNGVRFNHCWGKISIEDKLPPIIECPEPITLSCWDERVFAKPAAYDNCDGLLPSSSVTILSDITNTNLDCSNLYRAIREIRYQAKDAAGNLSAICVRTIYYQSISLTDIRFPKNYDSTPGHRPHLECDGTWPWQNNLINPNGTVKPFTFFDANGNGIQNINEPTTWDKNNDGYPNPAETGGPYIAHSDNINGFVLGYRVTTDMMTPINLSLPQCSYGNLVGNNIATGQWRTDCDNNTGTANFRIDTLYNSFTGNNSLCRINITWSDTRIDICEKSFKILRYWTVLDWCTGLHKSQYQIIKVVDTRGPVATIPPDLPIEFEPCLAPPAAIGAPDITIAAVSAIINADPYSCTGEWLAIEPINIFDCSGADKVTYTVSFALADAFGNAPNDGIYFFNRNGTTSEQITLGGKKRWILRGLPLGCTWIKYTLTDACGNSTNAFTEIRVIDKTPPVAVCDQFTVVTLGSGPNGSARVFAKTFDDGSHDNCTPVTFLVRRMAAGSCGNRTEAPLSQTVFGPYVNVCCGDVGNEVMVELQVSDEFGNRNSCMVIVNVQDKVRPVISCPPTITVNCTDETTVAVTGLPEFSDNCSNPTLTTVTTGTLNSCGIGTLTRTFTVTDRATPANSTACSQTIIVRNINPYNGPSWLSVPNVDLIGCMNQDTDPSKTGTPTINAPVCSQIAYTYEDQAFPFVDGVCFKILRRWTVIDWCKFAPNTFQSSSTSLTGFTRTNLSEQGPPYTYIYPAVPYDGAGLPANDPRRAGINTWSHIQVIKVTDNEKPVIQTCTKLPTDAFGENCTGYVELINSATDCTPSNLLKWTYQIDLNNDGIGPFTNGTTNNASGNFPVGTHKITWTVEDQCGNQSTCTYTFVVRDRKKPTPYCISDVTTVLMPSSGMVTIWARDFDLGSFDNCPGTLRFSFSPTVGDSSKTFTCANLGINPINMYVWDAAGNFDFCSVRIDIQATFACKGSRVAGYVGTENNDMVNDVQVTLQNTDSQETINQKTNTNGYFEFSGMAEEKNYMVRADKNNDHLNGVSTLDLVLIQRHILGIQKLNSPYKVIAADVNKDSRVTAADLVDLRKLILGIYEVLPSNHSWRFVDKTYTFSDASQPWTFNEYITINNLTEAQMHNDFVAIKVGDVNQSAKTNNLLNAGTENRTKKALKIVANETFYTEGDMVKVHITSDNFTDIVGAQMTLNFDQSGLVFQGITGESLKLSTENVNTNMVDDGKLAISWNQLNGLTINNQETLFTIEFRATTNNTISRTLSISSDITNSEAYTNALDEIKLELEFRTDRDQTLAFELLQNNPNPFADQTVIGFVLPSSSNATLNIYDVTGKIVKTLNNLYPKGLNQITIDANELNANGVLFYELESNGYKAIKKMIYLKK